MNPYEQKRYEWNALCDRIYRYLTMFDPATQNANAAYGDRGTDGRLQSTALVVEDHLDSLELLSFVLKNLGYSVLEARNGKDALRIATTRQFDLLVTDLGHPEMDGLELVRRVRAVKRNQNNLKIVMLSAYDPADCAVEAIDAGCDIVLAKPIDIQKFKRVIGSPRESAERAQRPRVREGNVQPYGPTQYGNIPGRHRNATMC